MLPGTLPLPLTETQGIAEFLNALAGGTWGDGPERAAAEDLGRRFPAFSEGVPVPGGMMGRQVHEERVVRARFAAWAVTAEENPGRLVMVPGCGYPCDPDPHTEALKRAPGARCAYITPSQEVAAIVRTELGGDRVSVHTGSLRDPDAIMNLPAVRAAGGPLQLQIPLAAHWWPPELAPVVIAAYAERLPAGSTLFLSLLSLAESPAGEELAAILEELGGGVPVFSHPAEDVLSWLDGAGLELVSRNGVSGVRAHGRSWAAGLDAAQEPGRIVYATARKPF